MKSMKTVYLLSRGEYPEDYHVEMAFLDKEIGEKAMKAANTLERNMIFYIEEYDLLEEVPKRILIHTMSELQNHWTYSVWDYDLPEQLRGSDSLVVLNRRPLIVRGTDYDEVMKTYAIELEKRK